MNIKHKKWSVAGCRILFRMRGELVGSWYPSIHIKCYFIFLSGYHLVCGQQNPRDGQKKIYNFLDVSWQWLCWPGRSGAIQTKKKAKWLFNGYYYYYLVFIANTAKHCPRENILINEDSKKTSKQIWFDEKRSDRMVLIVPRQTGFNTKRITADLVQTKFGPTFSPYKFIVFRCWLNQDPLGSWWWWSSSFVQERNIIHIIYVLFFWPVA